MSPLSANRGRGHHFRVRARSRVPMPPSYSRADPVRVSPRRTDRGEGVPLRACARALVRAPPLRGAGGTKKREGGHRFWVCACPVRVVVVRRGVGGAGSHSRAGPRFVCPICTQMGAGGRAPLACGSLHPPALGLRAAPALCSAPPPFVRPPVSAQRGR